MKYSPKTAKTLDQVCSLRSDHFDVDDFWIITNGPSVTICNQAFGKPAMASVTIPKEAFNRMLRWYQRPTRGKP